jgi:predicted nucleotidyltransferase
MDGAATALRRDHAARIAAAYAAEPKVAAVVLGGSTARGDADRFSDLELGVFWQEQPTEEDRSAAIARASGDLELLYPYDPEWRAWYDAWKVGRQKDVPKTGISVESVHVTVETVQWALDGALTHNDPSDTIQLLLSALVDGVPLHGRELLENARTAATTYPEALARAVAEQHGQIDHFWRFEMFRARDNPLLAHEAMVDIHQRVLRMLLAVSRVYFFGFKSLEAVAARLVFAPPELVSRIRAAYAAKPHYAEELLRQVVEETYDVVEQRLPAADVARLREIFRYRRPLWD